MSEPDPQPKLDFSDTHIAFRNKTDKELKKTAWLFNMMNHHLLISIATKIGYFAVKWRLPFTEFFVKKTIFEQFCGGENLMDCQRVIDRLYEQNALTILDYGAEGKSNEDDMNSVVEETLRAIEMAASNDSVPMISTKITGLVDPDILEKLNRRDDLSASDKRGFEGLTERLDTICEKADEHKVGIFIDAEETWIQDPIDNLAMDMMSKYNHAKAIVYNTYQMYRKDSLQRLKNDHQKAQEKGFILGAKLVRGAYMEKERLRAQQKGYHSPIHDSKDNTDNDFNEAIRYCVDNYETIASCCASHNEFSNALQSRLMSEKDIDKDHAHLNFCQLYGMSDHITFNLADSGYNVAKYVVYGPVREVVPYLIRRTEENSSVTGEMGRELTYIQKEMHRRGL